MKIISTTSVGSLSVTVFRLKLEQDVRVGDQIVKLMQDPCSRQGMWAPELPPSGGCSRPDHPVKVGRT